MKFTNKYGTVDKLGGGMHHLWVPRVSYRYNVLMASAIRTIYTSKCVQMDPEQLPETSTFYSICNKCDMQNTVGGWIPPPG